MLICERCHLSARPGHVCPAPSCEDVAPPLELDDFISIDRRLAAMFGYQPVADKLNAIDSRTARIEAAVDRIERGLMKRDAP